VSSQYPFGLTEPFTGVKFRTPTGYGFQYDPNAMQLIAHNCEADEILYGGATYGGKSFWLLMHTMMHCMTWGKNAFTAFFRRTYKQLEETIIPEVMRHLDGKLGEYRSSDKVFRWYNGAETRFCHMENRDDIQSHQGTNFTLMAWDELTHFEQDMYTGMFAWNRTPYPGAIHCQMIAATNPGNIGHQWVFDRFIRDREPMKVYEYETPPIIISGHAEPVHRMSRIFVPAKATDNKVGMKNDPRYLSRLRQGLSEDRFRALVEGDWNYFEGMAFSEWDEKKHVLAKPFKIPQDWKVIRCMDWGYKEPFYVGWLAQNPENKQIFLVDELYGYREGERGAIKGPEKPPQDVRAEIESYEHVNVSAELFP